VPQRLLMGASLAKTGAATMRACKAQLIPGRHGYLSAGRHGWMMIRVGSW
jgi:hypothetical protein